MRIDRADHQRELDRVQRDQAGRGVADGGKEIRGAEEQHDVGARDRRKGAGGRASSRRSAGRRSAPARCRSRTRPADADRDRRVVLAAIAPAGEQQQQQRGDEAGNDPARGDRFEPAQEVGADRARRSARRTTMTAVALRSAFFHAFGSSGAAATKSMISSSAATSRGSAMRACQRHEDQRRAEPGKSARRARDEGDRADRDRRVEADVEPE